MATHDADPGISDEEDLHDQLWEAIVTQNEDTVTELIQKGACAGYVRSSTREKTTILHTAAKIGNPNILETLLGTKCDINAGEGDIGTALHAAVNAHGDHQDVCKILVQFKAKLDATDKKGRTPLHDACRHQKTTICKLLIEEGASVTLADVNGRTVLHETSQSGNLAICVKILRDRQASVAAVDKRGRTSLHLASAGGHPFLCELLISAKADVECQDVDGRTPLHNAARNNHDDICNRLLSHGAKLETKDKRGRTALCFAVATQSEKTCSVLIDHGADINVAAGIKMCRSRRKPLIVKLSQSNTQDKQDGEEDSQQTKYVKMDTPSLTTDDGKTLLHITASCGGSTGIAQMLINIRDFSAKDTKGRTAYFIAAGRARHKLLEKLHPPYPSIDENGRTPLHTAAMHNHIRNCKTLLRLNPSGINTFDKDGNTPLHCAAAKGNFKICELLHARKQVDVHLKNKNGRTALHLAAARGDRAICKILVNKGGDPNAVDKKYHTPLHWSAYNNNRGASEVLILKGANVSIKDMSDNTPLHSAARNQGDSMCSILIKRKANVLERNKAGESPLDVWPDDMKSTAISLSAEVKKQSKAELAKIGTKQIEVVKLFLLGDPKAGKTTLKKSLSENVVIEVTPVVPLERADKAYASLQSFHQHTGMMVPQPPNYNSGPQPQVPLNVSEGLRSPSFPELPIFDPSYSGRGHQFPGVSSGLRSDPLAGMPLCISYPSTASRAQVSTGYAAEYSNMPTRQLQDLHLSDQRPIAVADVRYQAAGDAGIHIGHQAVGGASTDVGHQIVANDYIATAGIDVGRQAIGGAGDFCIWDCAGHIEFHVTHNMFLGAENSIFIVAYNLNDDNKLHLKKLRYWLSFIKAGHDYDSDGPIPIVQIVATHIDLVDNKQEGRACALDTLKHVITVYKSYLDIRQNLIVVDSREASFPDMLMLRSNLHDIGAEIKGSRVVPVICDEVIKRKDSWCCEDPYNQCPVMNWKDFVIRLRGIKLLGDQNQLLNVVDYLHDIGEIYRSKKIHGKHKVVLQPGWLCATVIGPTFAGRDFPTAIERLQDKPYFTTSDLTDIFEANIDVYLLVGFLQDLNLAFRYDEDRFVIPARLLDPEPKDIRWDPDKSWEYHGISLQCVDDTDMFTADVFPSLQVSLMKKYRKKNKKEAESKDHELLTKVANGIIKFVGMVEGLVELDSKKQAILIAVRCKKSGTESSYDTLKAVEDLAQTVLKERSPGTKVEKRYMSPSDLARKRSLKDVTIYTIDSIKDAYETDGRVRGHEATCDYLTDILCHGFDPIFLQEYKWDCDIIWLPKRMKDESKKSKAVGDVVFKNLDRKNDRVEDYRALAEILSKGQRSLSENEILENQGQKLRALVLTNSEEIHRANKPSISVTLVKEFWPKENMIPRTVGGLYVLLKNRGLIGNLEAAKSLNDVMEHFGYEFSASKLPSSKCINDIIPEDVQLFRATLRSYWSTLHKDIDPKQILRSLEASTPEILSEEDAEEILEMVGSERRGAGAMLLLKKLILCDQPHVYGNLLKALDNSDYGVRHLAAGMERRYQKFKELYNSN